MRGRDKSRSGHGRGRPGESMFRCGLGKRWSRARGGIWLAVGLLCPTALGQASQPADSAPRGSDSTSGTTWLRVTASDLNVRSRADANSVVVTRVKEGSILESVGRDQYGWYRVVPPEGTFSLVSARYIDRRGPEEGVVSIQSGTLRVRVGSLVHEGDPLQREVQARLENGARVRILGTQDGWLKVAPPDGVYFYVWGEHVTPVSPEIAARLRKAEPGGAGEAEPSSPTTAPAPAMARGPDLSGEWGQQLAQIERLIKAEAGKPLLEQSWGGIIERLQPVAEQRLEPTVGRLAVAWIQQLEQRVHDQQVVQAAEDVRRRAAQDKARHEREMERIRQVREHVTSRPAHTVRGELLRSYALAEREDRSRYRLHDPLNRRLVAYVEIDPQSKLDAEKLVGKYVLVRGERRRDEILGVDVYLAVEITELTADQAATQPARQKR
jgi:hypothetical protein